MKQYIKLKNEKVTMYTFLKFIPGGKKIKSSKSC